MLTITKEGALFFADLIFN